MLKRSRTSSADDSTHLATKKQTIGWIASKLGVQTWLQPYKSGTTPLLLKKSFHCCQTTRCCPNYFGIIDQAIASFTCTPAEIANACQQFYQQKRLTSEAERQTWLKRNGMSSEQLAAVVTRGLRIEKFKQATWEHKLETYFLKRKGQLDKVIFSVVQTKDMGLAQELYFRVQEGEQSFSEVAQAYSQGPEAQTGGFVGPVEASTLPPGLAQILLMSQPSQLWPPIQLGEWVVIVRLERSISARLDQPMCQRLLNELFETWLQEQLSQLPRFDSEC